MAQNDDETRPRTSSTGTSKLGIYVAHDFPLSLEIADPDNWNWSDAAKSLYTPASEEWISLREKWYGNIVDSLVDADSGGLLLGPRALTNQVSPRLSSSIFIRECYEDLFNTIWAHAMAKHGREGVIVTGQPGVGKTIFNFYVLVRLLQRKQVVLYYTGCGEMLLFFHDGVYTAPSSIGTSLPKAKFNNSDIFIWSLFDVAVEKRPEEFLVKFPLFPVQASSSGFYRDQPWRRTQFPLVAHLPLWSRDDLDKALRFQRQYSDMMQALRVAYAPPPAPAWDPLGLFPGARAILNAWSQDNLESGPSPDDALQHLLDTAIYRFGYSAGYVFKGIFSFKAMTQMHQRACRLTHAQLRSAVTELTTYGYPAYPLSSRIFVLEPVYDVDEPLACPDWHVDFKSPWVANNVIHELAKADGNATIEQIRYFQSIPEAHGILGRLLEPWAHRHIATGAHNHEGASRFWPLRSMFASPSHPPSFSLNKRKTGNGVPVGSIPGLAMSKRKVVDLVSIDALSSSNLKVDAYYIPSDPNFPLFDAFIVEIDRLKKLGILWVFHITTSQRHAPGSSTGYERIRQIIRITKEKFNKGVRKDRKIDVEVRYVLVVPEHQDSGEEDRTWQFPKGWDENFGHHDHRGKVYCLELSLELD